MVRIAIRLHWYWPCPLRLTNGAAHAKSYERLIFATVSWWAYILIDPGEFGIRLEDDLHITVDGAELLTAQSPSLEHPLPDRGFATPRE